ncbi:glycoprotein [Armigeres subalbatus rhabdovirus]|nr:glycoprotein [Armigeres subalbatus rhabdovirus]
MKKTVIWNLLCIIAVFQMTPVVGFVKVKDTTAELYYGPTSSDIHWSPIFPPGILCNKRPIPEQNRATHHKLAASKLVHFSNNTVHGYLCTKAIWTVICAEGFFGGRTLTHKVAPTLPTVAECADAVRAYRTNHHTGLGFPAENCGWMSTNSETEVNIQISEAVIAVDPYNQKYIDARFIGGSCTVAPCKVNTLDTIWMNTSSVSSSCSQRQSIDIFVKNFNDSSFYSNDLVSTSLKGACLLKVCGDQGIRLETGEWVKIPAKSAQEVAWLKDLSTCPELSEIHDVSLRGMMNHLEGQMLREESYRLCMESKERLMSGDPISRLDLAHIAPSVPLGGPVYRKNGDLVEVGYSEYALLRSPSNSLLGADPNIIGYDTVSGKPVVWKHWTLGNNTVRDGPNGITTVGRYLINPLVSLTTPGLYREFLERDFDAPLYHPNIFEGPLGHNLQIEYDPKNSSKELSKVIKHWWGSWSFSRLFWILIGTLVILTCLSGLFKYLTRQRKKNDGAVVYTPWSPNPVQVGVPTRI